LTGLPHNPINWADSSVTFQDHPNTLLVITTQSVLANQKELPSDDGTSSNLLEDLPDPNPVNIPEPTTKFITNPTVDLIPVPNTIPTSDPILNNSRTSPVPLISLCQLLGSGSRMVDSGLRRRILKGLGLSLCAVPS
jgi:hypothetical protein